MKFKVGDYVIPIDKQDTDYLKPKFIDGFVIKELHVGPLNSVLYARPTEGKSFGIKVTKIRLAEPHEIPVKPTLITKEQKDKLLNMIREI